MFDRFAEKLRERFRREEKPTPSQDAATAPVAAPPAPEAPAPEPERVAPTEPVPQDGKPAAPPATPPAAAEPAPVAEDAPAAADEAADKPRPGLMQRLQQGLQKGISDLQKDVSGLAGAVSPTRLFGRLRDGLRKTREGFVHSVKDLFRFGRRIDEAFWESLEEILITSDVGVNTSTRLVEDLQKVVKERHISDPSELTAVLKDDLKARLKPSEAGLRMQVEAPTVIMVVGVNGAGKTTTIGKLAWQLKNEGKRVMLGAADTFRAAAIDQLVVWAERCDIEIIRLAEGADPAAVAYDSVQAAKARGADVLILDTAGRLHSKVNLMEELKKVRRVMQRLIPEAPHEVLLVLDATTGQNALQQARTFGAAVDVTGLVLAKLDGTARGGILVAIADELKTPVKYIGIGERLEDLRAFDADAFVDALFAGDEEEPDVEPEVEEEVKA